MENTKSGSTLTATSQSQANYMPCKSSPGRSHLQTRVQNYSFHPKKKKKKITKNEKEIINSGATGQL